MSLRLNNLVGFGAGGARAPTFTLDGTAQDAVSSATMTYTMSGAIGTGSLIIVCAGSNAGNKAITGVSDSRGNTYALNANISGGSAADPICAIAMAPCTVALQAGDTITVTWSASNPSGHAIVVGRVDNPLSNTSAAFDQQATASDTSNTVAPATTLALAQSSEIAIGCFTVSTASAITESSGFTTIADFTFRGGAQRHHVGYKVTNTTTAVAYNPSIGAAASLTCAVATYKAAS